MYVKRERESEWIDIYIRDIRSFTIRFSENDFFWLLIYFQGFLLIVYDRLKLNLINTYFVLTCGVSCLLITRKWSNEARHSFSTLFNFSSSSSKST
jgi:hypothetical protein